MKKYSLLILIYFLTIDVSSQNLSVPSFGVKAGLNYSNLNFPQYNQLFFGSKDATEGFEKPENKANYGLKSGIFIDIRLSKKWYISPTLSYSQFGSTTSKDLTWDNTFPGDSIRTYGMLKNDYEMDYISLDPNFEYRVNDKLSLVLGTSFSYLIENKITTEVKEDLNFNNNYENNEIRTDDAYEGEISEVSDFDAGINIGGSIFLTENLDCDLIFYIGMIGLENENDGYNRTLRSTLLSIGYTF
tara:strand:+ start:9127 stop:9858 length:732 start_codon:yes stop_codon:yes gene_type:complete